MVTLSALGGEGVDRLLACAAEHLRKGSSVRNIVMSAEDGEGLAWLHAHGEVLSIDQKDLETRVEVRLSDRDFARFEARRAEVG